MARKASQKDSVMPERLGKLIELINGLPPDAQDRLKDIMQATGVDELPVVTIDYEFNSDLLEPLIKDFANYVGQLPIQVRDFIGYIHKRTIIGAITRWVLLTNAKRVLEEIARRNAATGKPSNEDDLLPPDTASLEAITKDLKGQALEDTKKELRKYKESFRQAWMQDQKAERRWIHKTMLLMWQQGIEATTVVTLQLNDKGRIEMAPSLLIDALQGVEAYRIRKCVICDQFFYATRTDLITCPKPKTCAGILRTRKWRDRYGEVYYKQRVDRANEKEAAKNLRSKK
jgi:hypothetical protein